MNHITDQKWYSDRSERVIFSAFSKSTAQNFCKRRGFVRLGANGLMKSINFEKKVPKPINFWERINRNSIVDVTSCLSTKFWNPSIKNLSGASVTDYKRRADHKSLNHMVHAFGTVHNLLKICIHTSYQMQFTS